MLPIRKTFPLTLSSITSVTTTDDGERTIPLLTNDSWNRDGQYLLPTEYYSFRGELLILVNLKPFDWRINIDCVILSWGIVYISQILRLVIRQRFLIWAVRRAFGLLKWLQSFLMLRLLGSICLPNRLVNPFPQIAPSRSIYPSFPIRRVLYCAFPYSLTSLPYVPSFH